MEQSSAQAIVLRAWKDEDYRQSLPAHVRENLPPRPEGVSELDDAQLEQAAGGVTFTLALGAFASGFVGGGLAAAEDNDLI